MTKLFLAFIIIINYSYASTKTIDKKIHNNQSILNKSASKKKKTALKIKGLSDRINTQNRNIIKLEKDIKRINSDIDEHTILLSESKDKIKQLKKKSTNLIREKKR